MNHQMIELVCKEGPNITRGHATRRDLSVSERALRAGKFLIINWVIAIFSIFVPILHFFLVPGFFILGIVFCFATWRDLGWIIEAKINCANCNKPIVLAAGVEGWPKHHRCQSCYMSVEIKPAGL